MTGRDCATCAGMEVEALAEERLSRREDGLYVYRCKRGSPLVLTAAQLVNRLLALLAPKGMHLAFPCCSSSHFGGAVTALLVTDPGAPEARVR